MGRTPQDLKVCDLWKMLLTDNAVLEAAKRAVDAIETLMMGISQQRSSDERDKK